VRRSNTGYSLIFELSLDEERGESTLPQIIFPLLEPLINRLESCLNQQKPNIVSPFLDPYIPRFLIAQFSEESTKQTSPLIVPNTKSGHQNRQRI
jgi:hypothetical protein